LLSEVNLSGIKLSTAAKVYWTKTELFRLTFAERISLSPKFGLSRVIYWLRIKNVTLFLD